MISIILVCMYKCMMELLNMYCIIYIGLVLLLEENIMCCEEIYYFY